MIETFETVASGKVIIVGEHAVVYGSKALAIPLNELNLKLKVQKNPDIHAHHLVRMNSLDISKGIHKELSAMVEDALKLLELPKNALLIEGSTTLPVGAGLGASASLCVALLRALSGLYQQPLTATSLTFLANELEKRFHGSPSGLDTTVIALSQPVVFEKGHKPKLLPTPQTSENLPWNLVLIDTQERSLTKEMVAKSKPYFLADLEEKIAFFNAIVDQVVQAFEDGSLSLLKDGIEKAAKQFELAGLVTTNMFQMMEKAKKHGVLAIKPTGAGGGGFLLGLLPSKKDSMLQTLEWLSNDFGRSRLFHVRM